MWSKTKQCWGKLFFSSANWAKLFANKIKFKNTHQFWSVAFSKTSPFSFEEISNKNNIYKASENSCFLWGYEQNNFVHLPVEQNSFVLEKITKTFRLAIFVLLSCHEVEFFFLLKHLLYIILDICVLLSSENTVVRKNENFIPKKIGYHPKISSPQVRTQSGWY